MAINLIHIKVGFHPLKISTRQPLICHLSAKSDIYVSSTSVLQVLFISSSLSYAHLLLLPFPTVAASPSHSSSPCNRHQPRLCNRPFPHLCSSSLLFHSGGDGPVFEII